MTLKGILSGITRHGFNRSDASALMRASFEETVDVLMESAMTANHSSVLTVTESIMLGQVSPVGTGCVKAILDMEKIKETIPLSEYVFEFEKNEYDGTTLATPIIQSPSLNQDNSVWGTMTPDPYISPSMESSYINSPVLNIGSSQPNSNSETFIPMNIHSPMSPSALFSPSSNGNIHSSFSPDIQQQSPSSSLYSPLQSGTTVLPQIQRPIYSPTSSLGAFSPLSPGGLYSPTSPRGALSPLPPGGVFSPTS
ncbi:DNA-directed RNA polymerase II subunit RPB1, partial [Dictyocoela roeselum]